MTAFRIKLLILASSLLLGLGLFAPCMTIIPKFGEFTSIVEVISKRLVEQQSFSIASGVWVMLLDGKYFIGFVIFIFSIVFPIWKLGVMWQTIEHVSRGGCPAKSFAWIEKLGKFSMIDIFVLALLVVAIKGLPGGTQVQINWGVPAFCISVLLSMKVPFFIRALDCNAA